MPRCQSTIATLVAAGLLSVAAATARAQPAPLADHHQHLFSPVVSVAEGVKPIDADDLITLLDAAGIRRAAVLSVAYILGDPRGTTPDEYDKVRAENDWTSAEVARFPERLVGFCSINPLKPYAFDELARCAEDPRLRRGLKLHFANSRVDYHNREHIDRLRALFAAANTYKMAIVAHMRTSISAKIPYGANEARTFLNEIVPAAPDVLIQVAHLAGAGGYEDPLVDEALSVLAEAIEKGDPRTRNLYFDVTTVVLPTATSERLTLIARRLRQIGLQRILYGSDAAAGGNLPPKEGWAAFQRLPMTAAEFQTIVGNTPAYMR
jgi:predicted TIM-barrel fold metal-dependent hydrolase